MRNEYEGKRKKKPGSVVGLQHAVVKMKSVQEIQRVSMRKDMHVEIKAQTYLRFGFSS